MEFKVIIANSLKKLEILVNEAMQQKWYICGNLIHEEKTVSDDNIFTHTIFHKYMQPMERK
ncbi:MAG TPA: hypothetical protein VGB37_00245 [Candidatus Lokiarchaeia archaeon]